MKILKRYLVGSRAIEIVSHLGKDEFHRLGKFLASPFFNTNKNLVKLYNALKRFYPDFTSPDFNKKRVFENVYKGQDYNDQKLRKLFSELHKVLDTFLVILQLENDVPVRNKLSLDILNSKKLDRMFIERFAEANEHLDSRGIELEYFLEKNRLQSRYIDFHLLRGDQYKICGNIFERSTYVIFFFLADLFINLHDISANKASYNFSREPNLPQVFLDRFDIESFLAHISECKLENKELIELYYYAYLSFFNFENENYFDKMKKVTMDNLNKLSRQCKFTAMSLLMNYCIQKTVLQSKGKFEIELNELYRIYMKQKLYKVDENSYISTSVFLFLLNNYLSFGKIEEAGDFLMKNLDDFHPEYRQDMIYYYNALLSFKERRYDNTLREISLIKIIPFIFKRSIKVLLLKTYYEMDLYDKAKETLNNYRKFLLADKNISESYRNIALGFVKIYNGLLEVKLKKEDPYLLDNLKKLAEESILRERHWLEEKLKELEDELVSG